MLGEWHILPSFSGISLTGGTEHPELGFIPGTSPLPTGMLQSV